MKFGIHTGLWLARWTDEITPAIRKAAELGYDGVEVSLLGMTDEKAAALGKVVADHDLEITCSDGLDPDKDITSEDADVRAAGITYLEWAIETTAKLGARGLAGVLFAPWGQFDPLNKPARLARSAEALAAVDGALNTHGVTLGLEALNRFETDLLNTSVEACALAEATGSPRMVRCLIPSTSILRRRTSPGPSPVPGKIWCISTSPTMIAVCRDRDMCLGIRSCRG
jgi:D-psicose/D-tagatose/L-ribulose 3-epimerase